MKKIEELRKTFKLIDSVENNNLMSQDYLLGVIQTLEYVLELNEENDILHFLDSMEKGLGIKKEKN